MKKIISLFVLLLATIQSQAQSPESGEIHVTKEVNVEFKILENASSSWVYRLYSEELKNLELRFVRNSGCVLHSERIKISVG